MTRRTPAAVAAAVCTLWVPAAATAQAPPAIPDLAKMAVDRADLPRGAAVLSQGEFNAQGLVGGYYRSFRIPRRSGLVRLESDVALMANGNDTSQYLTASRLLMSDPRASRGVVRLIARSLGVRPRKVRLGNVRALRLGDGAFTVSVKVGKVPIAIGLVRVDRVIEEVDVRGTRRSAPLMRRTRAILATAADHVRRALLPVSTSPPTITGGAKAGAVLQAGPGGWSDATKPTSFSYAWQRCDASGAACVPVPGAAQSSYTVTPADKASTIRVVVTAANAVGATTATSYPTLAIR